MKSRQITGECKHDFFAFPGPDFETTQFSTDPLEDQAILDGMEPVYYEEGFDPSEHELKVTK